MAEERDEMRAELERLRAENEALKTRGARELRLQVSQKGGVSLYGIRRTGASNTVCSRSTGPISSTRTAFGLCRSDRAGHSVRARLRRSPG